METLAYIDVKNLAHRIKGEVKMITGLDDDVCYPITQFAIFNRLTCDKAYRIMPEYAHEAMNVFVNDQVYNWLCGSEIPFKYVKWWMRESSSSLFVYGNGKYFQKNQKSKIFLKIESIIDQHREKYIILLYNK